MSQSPTMFVFGVVIPVVAPVVGAIWVMWRNSQIDGYSPGPRRGRASRPESWPTPTQQLTARLRIVARFLLNRPLNRS